jgi:hypothetical protein
LCRAVGSACETLRYKLDSFNRMVQYRWSVICLDICTAPLTLRTINR